MNCPIENVVMVYNARRRVLAFRCELCRYENLYRLAKKPTAAERFALRIENMKAHSGITDRVIDGVSWKERERGQLSRAKVELVEARGL